MCILSELYGRNCNLFAFQTQKFLILMRLFLSVRIGSATKQILSHSVGGIAIKVTSSRLKETLRGEPKG